MTIAQMHNFNERSRELDEAGTAICAFAHLHICVAHVAKKNTKKNEYTEDTIQWELFHSDLLQICVFVFGLKKSQLKGLRTS